MTCQLAGTSTRARPCRRLFAERRTTAWFSHNLNIEMPMVLGHAGYPLLMFPTAAADYLEYERFYLVDSIRPFIDADRLGLIQSTVSIVTACSTNKCRRT